MASKKPAAKRPARRKPRAKRAEPTIQTDRGPSAQDEAAKDTGQPDPEVTEGLKEIDDGRRQPLDYQPRHLPLENAGVDQHSAERQRQLELDDERDEHNARTGDASR